MSKLLLALSLVIGLSACTPSTKIQSNLSVTDGTGYRMSWTSACTENGACKFNSINNARSMYMGEELTYTCSLSGDLYMSRASYRAMTNLEQVKGATCTFTVERIPD